MARSRFFREDFDRGRDFIAKRAFVLGGKTVTPGQAIDKTRFSVRRLRQMYDQRFLDYPPYPFPPQPEETLPTNAPPQNVLEAPPQPFSTPVGETPAPPPTQRRSVPRRRQLKV